MVSKDCELKFRRGAIYSNNKVGSDVLTIRILPDMVGWKKEDLPKYPMFSPTQLIKGVSEAIKKINKSDFLTIILTETTFINIHLWWISWRLVLYIGVQCFSCI